MVGSTLNGSMLNFTFIHFYSTILHFIVLTVLYCLNLSSGPQFGVWKSLLLTENSAKYMMLSREILLTIGKECLSNASLNHLPTQVFNNMKTLGVLKYGRTCRSGRSFHQRRSNSTFKINSKITEPRHYSTRYGNLADHKSPNGIHTRNISNLINIKLHETKSDDQVNFTEDRGHSLSLCLINARSIKNKTAALSDYVCDSNADIYAITETWLTEDDDAVRAEMQLNGYKFIDHCRQGRRGGGIGLLYRDSIQIKEIDVGEKRSFQFTEWSVCTTNNNIRILVIYRPPYSLEHPVSTTAFLREFSDHLESIMLSKEQILIVGDFNIHIDNIEDPDAIKFLDLLESFGLQQHVTRPTHTHGHILDLIISRCSDPIVKSTPIVDCFISDHASLLCKLIPIKPPAVVKVIKYRKYNSIDIQSFKRDFKTSTLYHHQTSSTTDVDTLATEYNDTLSTLVDTHAPLKCKTVCSRPTMPWYTAEIGNAKRLRRKAEKKWMRTKSDKDLLAFKSQRNHVTFLMNDSRRNFYSTFITENSTNQRKLFGAFKKLLSPKSGPSFPAYSDSSLLANDIGQFFVQKIKKIRLEIDSMDVHDLVPDDIVVDHEITLSNFQPLTENAVHELIQKSAKKSCSLDPIPSTLLASCLDVLLPVITHLINLSLTRGIFPDVWKEALVTPLLKSTSGSSSEFTNLRPISNLQFISKLVERAVFDQLNSHIVQHSLYPMCQSAYRKDHSTETALLKVQNDLLMNMNSQQITLLVLLDLSAAFDTVDHKILLERLESSFGIRDTALCWFASYLTKRTQRITIDQCLSGKFTLDCGVPQGSCLGPLLFTIYASKLFDIVENHLPSIHAYADDTQLYISFSPKSFTSAIDAVKSMESCIKDIKAWMMTDKLKLNDGKTEFMIIGTKQQLAKINIDSLCVGNTNISPAIVTKNLGTWFDENMSMVSNINQVCKSAYFHLYNIRRIRKYLTTDTAQTLVQALITARIDYCNSLMFGLPDIHIRKLQRVQNSAARLICGTPRYSHITPVLHALHWLPVSFRIVFKIAVITFKAIHGTAPKYVCDLIQIREHKRYSLRSCQELLLKPPTVITKKSLGDRAFVAAAPSVWNTLPSHIKSEQSLNKFKNDLKTFLFKQAFACMHSNF